jgi:malonate transporter
VCRYTALNRSVWQPVESLVYYLLFPVLLFQSIVKSPVDMGAASGLIGAGLLSGLAGIALAYSLPYWPWLGKRIDAATTQPARRWRFASTPSSAWRWPSGWPARRACC